MHGLLYNGRRVQVSDVESEGLFEWAPASKVVWHYKLMLLLWTVGISTAAQIASIELSSVIGASVLYLSPALTLLSNFVNYRVVLAANKRLFGCK